jgi:hypothetical protein
MPSCSPSPKVTPHLQAGAYSISNEHNTVGSRGSASGAFCYGARSVAAGARRYISSTRPVGACSDKPEAPGPSGGRRLIGSADQATDIPGAANFPGERTARDRAAAGDPSTARRLSDDTTNISPEPDHSSADLAVPNWYVVDTTRNSVASRVLVVASSPREVDDGRDV